ncbi:tyrosine protein kinase of the MAP kinase kinase family [Beauveria bassiana ARSEF 2860]|uniref:mitogen-activated protein kinase kinase n=1 Tax=Beauveria bassiana (strain ARSEF 2860) TaxID=655819 RepID=J5JU75_BEAB2|nr:tyrosine protein kinase of the MAP kinase kinase family [Beauveria bassiana ARSEF 2860]EJP68328.1 tyrosine protein kinase of the MAP kinase kinase family [Beauveria bassiana ARSEF 2860]
MSDPQETARPSTEDQVSELPSQDQIFAKDSSANAAFPKRVPSLRSVSDPPGRNPNSTARGLLDDARNPARIGAPAGGPLAGRMGALNADVLAKARRLAQDRMKLGGSNASSPASPGPMSPMGASPDDLVPRMPSGMVRPGPVKHINSAPAVTRPSLMDRRGAGLKLSDMSAGGGSSASPAPSMRRAGAPKLSDMGGCAPSSTGSSTSTPGSKLDDFKKYIDAEKGWITFDGAATITKSGVNFANGQTFKISLDEVESVGELGKGNYGTVYKVRHTKRKAPRFGQGLSGFKAHQARDEEAANDESGDGTPGKLMAMKEIRLELDDAKFTTILKELVILHECVSPYIIDFYGAFYQEGAVYMCIEYMDGGSIDKLYRGGIPEGVLRKITNASVHGLKSLKDDHNIIHRDVKPTNILVNTRGQVKICDFGVSGNLVASIAKTNIGCQSYMAPERISGGALAQSGNPDGSYSVQSDVWSLGLTIIECAMGRYPYPPEVSSTIFGQLNAIVDGEPPTLPGEGYSDTAHDFVKGCTNKVPLKRPTYAAMLKHPWLSSLSKPVTIAEEAEEGEEAEQVAAQVGQMTLSSGTDDDEVAEWVRGELLRRATGQDAAGNDKTPTSPAQGRPALHAVPLTSVSPLGSPAASE